MTMLLLQYPTSWLKELESEKTVSLLGSKTKLLYTSTLRALCGLEVITCQLLA